jgi:hypothetical protein
VKKEQDNEEAVKAALMVEYERRQRLIASSDDPEDCPGNNVAYMASLNDKDAWRGNINDVIAMSIRDSDMPLVDLTHDGEEAGPSGAVKDEPIDEDAIVMVKDEPVDEDADPRSKQDDVDDGMYNFHQYYDRSGHCKFY